MESFQALLSTLRKDYSSSLTQLHEAEDKAGIDEERVRSCTDAKERAELWVAELEASKQTADKNQAIQRLLTDQSSAKVTELTRAIEQLDHEKGEALRVPGDAVDEMQANGQRDEERSAELFELRHLLHAKSEECSRLQLL